MGYHATGKFQDCFNVEATKLAARKMADKGGDEMQHVAARNTPVRSGKLREGWHRTPATKSRSPFPAWPAYASTVANDVEYAGYVESGTGMWGPRHAKYEIKPKKPGGMLHWIGKDGEDVFARRVMHPGSPGNHMMAIAANVTEHETSAGLMDGILAEWRIACEHGRAGTVVA